MTEPELEAVHAALVESHAVISEVPHLRRLQLRLQVATVLVDRELTNGKGVLAMAQAPAAAAPAFPEIDLDASAPAPSYHKVVIVFAARQDGGPWAKQTNEYEHASNAAVSIITGELAAYGGRLGPKGNRPKNANFDLSITMTVDGQSIINPPAEWNGVSREAILAAERGMLEMFLRMNEDSLKANKAHGKI